MQIYDCRFEKPFHFLLLTRPLLPLTSHWFRPWYTLRRSNNCTDSPWSSHKKKAPRRGHLCHTQYLGKYCTLGAAASLTFFFLFFFLVGCIFRFILNDEILGTGAAATSPSRLRPVIQLTAILFCHGNSSQLFFLHYTLI